MYLILSYCCLERFLFRKLLLEKEFIFITSLEASNILVLFSNLNFIVFELLLSKLS